MILPSLSVALLLLLNLASTQPSKRQSNAGSAAAAAALLLNQALAYQICIIAAGSFAAVQAIQGTKLTAPVCVAPIIIKPSTNAVSILTATGCSTSPTASASDCRTNNFLGIDGSAYPGPISTRNPFYFTIPSTNSKCSGVVNPFILGGVNNLPIAYAFASNSWDVNCNTGALTLSNSSLHLCLANYQIYSTVDPTCSSNFTISALTFAPSSM